MPDKILIVDDEEDTVNLAKMILESEGFEIISALNGEEGLRKAFSEKPDLILLDVVLPDKDGFEICEILKTNPKTKNITISMFTVKRKWNNIKKGNTAGADSYIIKPFTPKELTDEVKRLLKY